MTTYLGKLSYQVFFENPFKGTPRLNTSYMIWNPFKGTPRLNTSYMIWNKVPYFRT